MKTEFSLSAMYVTMYKSNKASLTNFLHSLVARQTMIKIYNLFVKEENVIPIEKLPKEDKELLVKECRDTGLKFTNATLIEASKILHTLKFINANS